MISSLGKQGGRRAQMGNTSPIIVGRLLSLGTTEVIPPVVETPVTGFGNWNLNKEPKRKIRLVRKLSKELKEIDEKIKKVEEKAKIEAKTSENNKQLAEMVVYEKLLYDELVREFDETAKQAISAIEQRKTEKVLTEIKMSMEAKKLAQLAEEQDVIFAFISLM